MQPSLPHSTPTGAPMSPDPSRSSDPLPILIGQLSTLLRRMEAPPALKAEELKDLTELLRALHRQNTTLISRPQARLPWTQLAILTSIPVLAVLLILTFLRPSWLVAQPNLVHIQTIQAPAPLPPRSVHRSTSRP